MTVQVSLLRIFPTDSLMAIAGVSCSWLYLDRNYIPLHVLYSTSSVYLQCKELQFANLMMLCDIIPIAQELSHFCDGYQEETVEDGMETAFSLI